MYLHIFLICPLAWEWTWFRSNCTCCKVTWWPSLLMQKSTCFLHLNLSCLMSQVSSRHPCRRNNYLLWHLIDGLLMKKWILPVCLGIVKDEQFKDIIMTTGFYMLFQNLILDLCFLLSNLLLTFCFKKICFRVITLSLCIKILIMPAVYMLIVTWSKTFKWQTDSLWHTSFLITPFQHSLEGFITPPLATCLLTTILWELPPPEKQDIWLHENGERPAVQCPDYLVQDPVCIRVSMLKMRYLVTIRNACSLIYRHYGRTNSGIIDGRSCSRVDGSCRWTCS